MSAAWFIVRLIERVGVSPRPGSLRYRAGGQNWRRGGLMATREERRETTRHQARLTLTTAPGYKCDVLSSEARIIEYKTML